MNNVNPEWRSNVKNIDSLWDIDPVQMLIFLRHQYLLTAKESTDWDDNWEEVEEQAIKTVDALQMALEANWSYQGTHDPLEVVFVK
jgi:hypothetical protein